MAVMTMEEMVVVVVMMVTIMTTIMMIKLQACITRMFVL